MGKRIAFVTLSREISVVCFSRAKPPMYVVAKFVGAFRAFVGQAGLILWLSRVKYRNRAAFT